MDIVQAVSGSSPTLRVVALVLLLSAIYLALASRPSQTDRPPYLKDTIPYLSNTIQYLTDAGTFLERVA